MEFNNIEKLTIQRVDDGSSWTRVVMTLDGVRHVADKTDLMECFESLNAMLNSPDYPEKLKHFKDNR